jgi:hypothetical protein
MSQASSRLVMYNYVCINPKCNTHSHQHIKKLESEAKLPEFCIDCLQRMKLVGEILYGGLGGNFRQSSPAQRKEMLLQRSSKHFKTSGLAERKRAIGEEYKKQAVSHFKQ